MTDPDPELTDLVDAAEQQSDVGDDDTDVPTPDGSDTSDASFSDDLTGDGPTV